MRIRARFTLTFAALIFVGGIVAEEISTDGIAKIPADSAAAVPALSSDAVSARIADLRADIAHHDELYFRKSAPEISDAAYDQLKRELAVLEKDFPAQATGVSPSESLGDDRSGKFPLYRHRERMLSLDKSYSETELRAFHARVARELGHNDLVYVVEPKFDGLAISVTYERGKLTRAVTRGNGIEGDDVTENIRAIKSLPQELKRSTSEDSSAATTLNPIPDLIELRGEVYLPLADFRRLNREREAAGETPFSHPRNVASGTLKQTDPTEVIERGLKVVFYGWGACVPATAAPNSQQQLHASIKSWGLPGVEKYTLAQSADDVWRAVKAFDRDRPKLGFPVDGAVVKLDPVAGRGILGFTEHAPRWAMAYKFSTERVETRLLAITVQVGRSGVLTPVGELHPVKLTGSTVTKASLHNRDQIARLDFRVGDFVYVEKAGEVIPAIVGVDTARRAPDVVPFIFPVTCPVCQTPVVVQSGQSAVRCPNPDCPAQLCRRLLHFVSKSCVDIPGMGPALVESLIAKRRLKNVADFFRLRREDLWEERAAADRILAGIERSKHAELWRFIYGFGIPQVGAVTARDLAARFGGLKEMMDAHPENFLSTGDGVSLRPSTSATVTAYFSEKKNRDLVSELLALGVTPTISKGQSPKPSFK